MEDFSFTPVFNPFVLFLVLFFSAFLLLKLTKSGKYKLPPSPPRLPIIGNLHQLSSLPHQSLRLLSDKYGPLLLIHLGQSQALVVSSPKIVRDIMRTHDIIFANRQKTVAADVLFYGGNEVVFSPHGENWKEARKILASELLSQRRLQLLHDNRKKQVELMIAKIRQSCVNQKVPVNIGEMMFSMFATVLCEFVFGEDYGGEEYGKQFTRLAQKISELVLAFSFKEFFPIMGWMDKFTGLDMRLEGTWKEIDDFLVRVIEEHERHMKSKGEQFEEKDCVDVLLHLKNGSLAGVDLTMDNIKALILDMIIGGLYNSATTMEWVMAELAGKPSAMKKAKEEVRGVVGNKTELGENDMSQMEYLSCVIKETLRLHPPAPLLLPRQTSAYVKLQGYDIPPKTNVLINAWAIQRDPNIWDMPDDFQPERFRENPLDFRGQQFEFIPFGGGRRRCPGISLSLTMLEYGIANLLYWFDWELPKGEDMDMSEAQGAVVQKKIPLRLVPTPYSP